MSVPCWQVSLISLELHVCQVCKYDIYLYCRRAYLALIVGCILLNYGNDITRLCRANEQTAAQVCFRQLTPSPIIAIIRYCTRRMHLNNLSFAFLFFIYNICLFCNVRKSIIINVRTVFSCYSKLFLLTALFLNQLYYFQVFTNLPSICECIKLKR